MKGNKILSPKLDVVFHMLFGEKENERITKSLIEDVIQEKVEIIELEKTPYLWGSPDFYSLTSFQKRKNISRKLLSSLKI